MDTKRMNPLIKARWTAALRSGKYEQGRLMLRNRSDNTYCCLGVLCDVIDPDGWDIKELPEGGHAAGYGYGPDNRCDKRVPPSVRDNIGIDGDAEGELISYNDDCDWTFDEIADWIDENM